MKSIIDTGATASFVPVGGKIIKYLCPNMELSDTQVTTVNELVNTELYKAHVTIKPWGENQPPQHHQILIIDLGNHIFGADIVLGLPELKKLASYINFTTEIPSVIWDSLGGTDLKQQPKQQFTPEILATTLADTVTHQSQTFMSPVSLHSSNKDATNIEISETKTKEANVQVDTIESIIKQFKDVFATKLNGSTMNAPQTVIELYTDQPVSC